MIAGRGKLLKAPLVERDSDPILLPPDDMADQAQSILRYHQEELFGYTRLAGYLYRSSRNGQVADQAINRIAADELNDSGLRDAVAGCNASFDHTLKNTAIFLGSRNSTADSLAFR